MHSIDKETELKNIISKEIADFISAYEKKLDIPEKLWDEPLVGFADVSHPAVRNLRKTAHPLHQMPEEVIPDASIVLTYYVPFTEEVVHSNEDEGLSSPLWAMAYEYTNTMLGECGAHMKAFLEDKGYHAASAPEAGVFYRDEIVSHWSHRHFAYACGLGTFGMNNMLLTEKGCSGRFGTLVTNLDIKGGEPLKEEICPNKRDGSCGICMEKCPMKALKPEGFDRFACYDRCLENSKVHTQFGSSYASGEEGENAGSEVCGKCLTGLPCTFKRP